MFKTLIWCSSAVVSLVALVVIVTIASAASPRNHESISMQPKDPIAAVTPTEVPVQPLPNKIEDEKVAQLSSYIQDAMTRTVKPDKKSAPYNSIARDISEVVLDPGEPPIWKDDVTKARTAIMVLGVAFWETRFRAFVDNGSCNNSSWRSTLDGRETMAGGGSCDGGYARSLWQIHMESGITVVPANYDDESRKQSRREWCYSAECDDFENGTIITPQDVLTDRKNAVRVALHMIRRSIRNRSHLCQFTGEGGSDNGGCPKGEIRYNWAIEYSRKHPFTAVQE